MSDYSEDSEKTQKLLILIAQFNSTKSENEFKEKRELTLERLSNFYDYLKNPNPKSWIFETGVDLISSPYLCNSEKQDVIHCLAQFTFEV
jgi:hypothetical protein